MAMIYMRRLQKGGYLGEAKKEKTYGTPQDFVKVFGSQSEPNNG